MRQVGQINGWLLGLGCLVVFAEGCTYGAKLRASLPVLTDKVSQARDDGAYYCAPRNLALAEAHLRFFQDELSDGNFRQADRHRHRVDAAVTEALLKTDPEKCSPDTDQDGLIDKRDMCPNEAEDMDQFQDEDGCPDHDNDQDAVVDTEDKCPLEAGPIQNNGCPLDDQDKDGVLDTHDQCVDKPGPESNAGCPVLDRDKDGLFDDVDECPDIPGRQPSGCPERMLVKRTAKQIEITQQIRFKSNQAVIEGDISFEILTQVSQVLQSNPDIRIVIDGHTDSVGDIQYNQGLSQRRAQAVMDHLIALGVDVGRLKAIGFGESEPIASNKTRKGRLTNRRVEFQIVKPHIAKTAVK